MCSASKLSFVSGNVGAEQTLSFCVHFDSPGQPLAVPSYLHTADVHEDPTMATAAGAPSIPGTLVHVPSSRTHPVIVS